jgi:glutaminyl-tRNA synthetase
VGHAKSICINFGLARDYGGVCHLRFDDTNPEKEDTEYVNSIIDAVKWLGFDWNGSQRRQPPTRPATTLTSCTARPNT